MVMVFNYSTPEYIEAVLEAIETFHEPTIVECSASESTIAIAEKLAVYGGQLFTLEDSILWFDKISLEILNRGFSGFVRVLYSPIESIGDLKWYSTDILKSELLKPIDILMVDGPEPYMLWSRNSRYPAVPFLMEYLAENAIVILDDANHDQKTIEKWEKLLHCDAIVKPQNKGVAIFTRKPVISGKRG